MPGLCISTNVNLDGVDTGPVFFEITRAVAIIMGKPEHMIMVVLKGSVDILYGGSKEPAAFGEIAVIGEISREEKRSLISALGMILETKLGIPRTRFFFKVHAAVPSGRRNMSPDYNLFLAITIASV